MPVKSFKSLTCVRHLRLLKWWEDLYHAISAMTWPRIAEQPFLVTSYEKQVTLKSHSSPNQQR